MFVPRAALQFLKIHGGLCKPPQRPPLRNKVVIRPLLRARYWLYVRIFTHPMTLTMTSMTIINITFVVGDPSYYNLPLLTMVGRGSIPSHRHMQINVVLCLVFATKCMYFFPSSTFWRTVRSWDKKTETPDIQTSPEQRCGPPRHRPRLFGCLGNQGLSPTKALKVIHSWLITVSHHPILGDFPKPVQWWVGMNREA